MLKTSCFIFMLVLLNFTSLTAFVTNFASKAHSTYTSFNNDRGSSLGNTFRTHNLRNRIKRYSGNMYIDEFIS